MSEKSLVMGEYGSKLDMIESMYKYRKSWSKLKEVFLKLSVLEHKLSDWPAFN